MKTVAVTSKRPYCRTESEVKETVMTSTWESDSKYTLSCHGQPTRSRVTTAQWLLYP